MSRDRQVAPVPDRRVSQDRRPAVEGLSVAAATPDLLHSTGAKPVSGPSTGSRVTTAGPGKPLIATPTSKPVSSSSGSGQPGAVSSGGTGEAYRKSGRSTSEVWGV